jgi:hypothetical protein
MMNAEAAPIHVNIHIVTTLSISAADARRKVNRQVVPEPGIGLIGRDPDLVIEGERILWRVPIELSLPGVGDLGQVGHADVNARTGEVRADDAMLDKVIQHARRLAHGTALPPE